MRVGLIKVCLSYEHRTLPANLHFHTPNPNNAGLKDGILKVVTSPTEFTHGIVALSNFGFGGGCSPLRCSCGLDDPIQMVMRTLISKPQGYDICIRRLPLCGMPAYSRSGAEHGNTVQCAGSNIHLLLEGGSKGTAPSAAITEITEEAAAAEEESGSTPEIIPLSARTKEGMADLVKVLKALPGQHLSEQLDCYSHPKTCLSHFSGLTGAMTA